MGVASASVEAEASAVTCRGAVPEAGVTVRLALGAESDGDVTVTCVVAVDERPPLSVTVTVTVYIPVAVYVWPAVAPACGPTTGEPSPKSNLYVAIGVASLSEDALASAVTASGALPDEGATVRRASGGASLPGAAWNSYAPLSSNGRGPTPVFGVAGSSTRGCPSTSTLGWAAAPESAESIAGEPASRWKFPPARSTHFGSAWIPCASWPDAAWKAAREE